MNLYRISQDENNDYDTYDSAIVCAKDEESARKIRPDNATWEDVKRKDYGDEWAIHPEQVTVELIGTAKDDIKEGVILASFNAG